MSSPSVLGERLTKSWREEERRGTKERRVKEVRTRKLVAFGKFTHLIFFFFHSHDTFLWWTIGIVRRNRNKLSSSSLKTVSTIAERSLWFRLPKEQSHWQRTYYFTRDPTSSFLKGAVNNHRVTILRDQHREETHWRKWSRERRWPE